MLVGKIFSRIMRSICSPVALKTSIFPGIDPTQIFPKLSSAKSQINDNLRAMLLTSFPMVQFFFILQDTWLFDFESQSLPVGVSATYSWDPSGKVQSHLDCPLVR